MEVSDRQKALTERVLDLLTGGVEFDDDEIAGRLSVNRQHVNQVCRRLASQGRLVRRQGSRGKIVNCVDVNASPPTEIVVPVGEPGAHLTEDEVKRAVRDHLVGQGYDVDVRWGRERGIDIDAVGPLGRLVLEAKGEVALQPQQVNYFLGALGELIQRMSDADAAYGLALPDNRQYRGLVARLPSLARERLRLRVLFVRRDGAGYRVEET